MTPDYNRAAIMAAETLVKYNIQKTPVAPLPILEKMENVIVLSFAELGDLSGVDRSEIVSMMGKNRDAITSKHTEGGKTRYIVAYNKALPFGFVQRALARELGHIVLNHDKFSKENTEEANCFACHLLCPRPLIHIAQATGIRITVDMMANLTGLFDQSLTYIRHLPGTDVPANLNSFVRSQFMPFFLNVFDYYQTAKPNDGSALADFGTYMDKYTE